MESLNLVKALSMKQQLLVNQCLLKKPGEKVFGGSINNEGVLKVKITKAYEDSSLAKILHLVEEAQETKTPTEQFINQIR